MTQTLASFDSMMTHCADPVHVPEASLHPDLLPALARLIARAAEHAQVIVVSHATDLIAALERQRGCHAIPLEKELGETRIAGTDGPMDRPAWNWPAR